MVSVATVVVAVGVTAGVAVGVEVLGVVVVGVAAADGVVAVGAVVVSAPSSRVCAVMRDWSAEKMRPCSDETFWIMPADIGGKP